MGLWYKSLPRHLPHRKAIVSLSRKHNIPLLSAASLIGCDALLPLLKYAAAKHPEGGKSLLGATHALYFAVDHDCAQCVEALILGAGANAFHCVGESTATHIAAARGKCRALEAILRIDHLREATDVINERGCCPIHLAAWNDQTEAVRMLVHHDAAALVVKASGEYCANDLPSGFSGSLTCAGEEDVFYGYFSAGSHYVERGSTVAHVAVHFGKITVLEEVVRLAYVAECGPDVRPLTYVWPKNRTGYTKLRMQLASCSLIAERVESHLGNAGKNAIEKLQSNALGLREGQSRTVSSTGNSLEREVSWVVEELACKSARECAYEEKQVIAPDAFHVSVTGVLEARDEQGRTPLLCAAEQGEERVVRFLESVGANVFARGLNLETALHRAAGGFNCGDVLDILVHEYRLDVAEVDETGQTALHYVGDYCAFSDENILALLDVRADVNSKCCYNQTPLFIIAKQFLYTSCFDHRSPFVKLVRAGADVNVICGWKDPRNALSETISQNGSDFLSEFLLYANTDSRKRRSFDHYVYDLLVFKETHVREVDSKSIDEPFSKSGNFNEWGPEQEHLLQIAVAKSVPLDADGVQLLMEAGANVNYVDKSGWRALHYAAKDDRYADIIQVLVDYGADVTAATEDSEFGSDQFMTPLHLASKWNASKCVRALLSAGGWWDLTGTSFPLDEAVKSGALDAAKVLIEHGAKLCSIGEFGYTPIHTAAYHGRASMVELLLDAGCPVDTRSTDLSTALHWAVAPKRTRPGKSHRKIALTLLSRGADVNAVDSEMLSPLHLSAMRGDEKMTRLLLEAGANVNSCSASGDDPFLTASEHGNLRVLVMLLDHGAYIDSRNNSGETALHAASRNGETSVVQYLLRSGSDPFAVDNDGVSALQYAARSEQGTVSRALLESIGGVDTVSKKSVFEFLSPCASESELGDVDDASTLRQERHMECEMDDARARCGICYSVFRNRDVVRSLGCAHMFHDVCILSWFSSGYGIEQMSCPMCRQPLLNKAAKTENHG